MGVPPLCLPVDVAVADEVVEVEEWSEEVREGEEVVVAIAAVATRSAPTSETGGEAARAKERGVSRAERAWLRL